MVVGRGARCRLLTLTCHAFKENMYNYVRPPVFTTTTTRMARVERSIVIIEVCCSRWARVGSVGVMGAWNRVGLHLPSSFFVVAAVRGESGHGGRVEWGQESGILTGSLGLVVSTTAHHGD
jgi:hypothetical protein